MGDEQDDADHERALVEATTDPEPARPVRRDARGERVPDPHLDRSDEPDTDVIDGFREDADVVEDPDGPTRDPITPSEPNDRNGTEQR